MIAFDDIPEEHVFSFLVEPYRPGFSRHEPKSQCIAEIQLAPWREARLNGVDELITPEAEQPSSERLDVGMAHGVVINSEAPPTLLCPSRVQVQQTGQLAQITAALVVDVAVVTAACLRSLPLP